MDYLDCLEPMPLPERAIAQSSKLSFVSGPVNLGSEGPQLTSFP